MTTNIQLDNFVKKQKKLYGDAKFLGVYPSDKLPTADKNTNFCLITNYDPSNKQGSHWVAMSVLYGKAYWFDSYGMKPDSDDLILKDKTNYQKYLLQYSDDVIYNDIDFQSLETEVCGLYSVYFCIHGLPKKNKEAWKHFSRTNTEYNDKLIKTYVPIPSFRKQ